MERGDLRPLAKLTAAPRRRAASLARARLAGLWGLAGALGCAPLERVGERSVAIIDGTIATEDDAVVGLTAEGELFCSGTLVAAHVVMTAAHCLPPEAPIALEAITVFRGVSWADGSDTFPIDEVWVHPAHLTGATGRDVGLVATVDAVGPPVALRAAPPAVGEVLRIVGFGRTDPDAAGDDVRRAGAAEVVSVSDDGMILGALPAVTCGGDSGGPAFAAGADGEELAGVHSRGSCEFEMTEMRADLFVTDVERFVAEHPPPSCAEDGRCALGCASPDPDCPCALDGGCNTRCDADPDCPVADAPEDGGCAVASAPTGRRGRWGWLGLVAVAWMARRPRAARSSPRSPQRAVSTPR